jgi:YHS domain-containing protein
MEYGGALFGTCCGGCDAPFLKDPKTAIAKATKANKAIGIFEYDAVTGQKIDAKKAVAFSDYKAIRYLFASADEKKSFDATPTKFVGEVKSEAYFCPVMKHATEAKNAGGFADYNGTRYYLCCGDCVAEFKKDSAKFAANAAAATKPLAAVTVPAKK